MEERIRDALRYAASQTKMTEGQSAALLLRILKAQEEKAKNEK